MADTQYSPLRASCDCGVSRLRIKVRPFARFICHCTICQAYTGRPFSDVTVMRARDVEVDPEAQVCYRKHRLPPNIERGTCASCGKPVLEYGLAGPAKLAFVPTANYADSALLPPASLHIFYHRRIRDKEDGLPRHSGYLRSQFAVIGLIVRGLLSGAKQ